MPGLTNEATGTATACAVQDVFDLVNAELELRETGGVLTSTAAEQNVYVSETPLGCFKPIVVFISLDAMAAGADSVTIRLYYRIAAAPAGYLLSDTQTYTGVDGGLAGGRVLVAIDLHPNRFGCRVTLQRVGGADYAFPWAVHLEN